jgi:hypothetical protein
MSKEHIYETNLVWTGNLGDGTKTYRRLQPSARNFY